MTMQYPTPEVAPQPPSKPTKKKHPVRNGILVGVGMFVGLGIVAAAISSGKTPTSSASEQGGTTQSTTAQTSAPPPAPPVPNPSGTSTESCNYSLAPDMSSDNYLTGEVDVTNTGHVGIVVRVKLGWPQEGSAPIYSTQTVKVPYGASGQPVSFKVDAGNVSNSNVIDNLQAWESGHNYPSDDCQNFYKVTIIRAYGAAVGS